ncbi:thiolase domain-containing protein [Niveispirillum sp.]|uniref:thiolase domain-containing protein n=1 Tax=Niveispirillum sp. TaxID=1917217 RepID=UPI001B49A6BA|nr:thiolase domain-containing protein [Niveispirillum sp.]MBP7336542.1 thiolase domain-containing protein [Niveispirillum sp.]
MSLRGAAHIVGIHEYPDRKIEGKTLAQLHAEVARAALDDAGLTKADVDAYFTDSVAPGLGPMSMIDYLGLDVRHAESTDTGGASYLMHVSHAAQAIRAGKCDVALITFAGMPRSGQGTPLPTMSSTPESSFELPYRVTVPAQYALAARRHMHEFGTTPEQLAWIKVAASHHAQHNPHAMLREVVTVADVVNSRMVADPLHLLDCCVVSDGAGAIIVARPEIARSLKRPGVRLRGAGEAVKTLKGGRVDLTTTAAARSGPIAFAEAGVTPADIKYASIYDSFTITVLLQLEDLGFCAKGRGGAFVADGNLISGIGKLPFNTDGGGLCNNHPNNRGGATKIFEAVRQLRGEAHPAVQVANCDLALVQATGAMLTTRHSSATLVLEAV